MTGSLVSRSSRDEKTSSGAPVTTTQDESKLESNEVALPEIDPSEEKKLLAKVDLFLTPVIMLVYLCCFLDRSNIGNVKVAGMPEDIGASSQQFSTAVSIFYATYVTFETPWALALKKFTPRFVITGLCIVWSLATIFSGFIVNVGGLYAVRLILGACEAGLFPSLNLYLTMVYRREEQAKRVSYLFVSTAIAGAFGGILAYGILFMDGIGGYAGWRWVFIIEGLFSVVCAIVVWFGLPNDMTKAYFLNSRERYLMTVRAEQNKAYSGSEDFDWNEVKIAAKDTKTYISGGIQFCQDILLYGFSTFLPSILTSMGHTGIEAQYLSVPVYIFGGICFVIFAFISDRLTIRGPFIFLSNIFGIVGYILLLATSNNAVKFFATFMCAVSVYNGPGLNVTWLNVSFAPHYRRATAIGLQQTMGNTAGVVAGQIYRDDPYILGHSFSLGSLAVAQGLIVLNLFYLKYCDRVKAKIKSGEIEDKRKIRTGDRDLDFKYHI
ncbi:hypothetical protein AJ79_05582 [Helicocarpus griseus UAMH5409]|uniref:Major facilitator superfamily (MFS) profile domain-containing protein n=1 Tax=Helicocarpus griseus UAMH5409 TaxID=1447875 RepID=A0A2B7XL18_9EURO|nr:hypothetical protein AJ79_05582 [Helicocarpus griseus UAMH5409]